MENQPTNPVKAIRAKCLECSCGNFAEVERRPVTACALYPFRFGKNPFRKKFERSEEQKEAMLANLAKSREARKNGSAS